MQLHPAVLESQGLRAAIEAAAAPLRAADVSVEITDYHDRHPIEIEQLAYRLVQEAFANTLKHSRARAVRVSIEHRGDRLHVSVADDGVGFDTAELKTALARGHLGLQLVRERVELAGGKVEISARRRAGTRVAFALPAPREVDAAPAPEEVAA